MQLLGQPDVAITRLFAFSIWVPGGQLSPALSLQLLGLVGSEGRGDISPRVDIALVAWGLYPAPNPITQPGYMREGMWHLGGLQSPRPHHEMPSPWLYAGLCASASYSVT